MPSSLGMRLSARLLNKSSKVIENAFTCRRCIHQAQQQSIASQQIRSIKQSPFLTAFKQPGHYKARYATATLSDSTAAATLSETTDLQRLLSHNKSSHRSNSDEAVPGRRVAYWLLGSAGVVFIIVVVGGLTRLTESGLSITEWRPVTGSVPPLSQQVWEEEFALYKKSPEFIMLNSNMQLEDFKKIYWMEWGHRLLGRMLGVGFLLPTIYLVARRKVSKVWSLKLLGICGMIGFQGFLGWWMVKSGLKDDLLQDGSHPRVSQYRLAAHLGTAFLTYVAMLWNGLQILQFHRLYKDENSSKLSQALASPEMRMFRRSVFALSILVFTTVLSGALVAGLDAGLIYTDFPYMGGQWLPPTSELVDIRYSREPSQSDLLWRNVLENPVLAQLDHRLLATTTFCSIIALLAYSRLPQLRPILKATGASNAVLGATGIACMQVTLGITTLWYLVPTPLASMHQAGALALLSSFVFLTSRITWSKSLRSTIQLLARQRFHQARRQNEKIIAK